MTHSTQKQTTEMSRRQEVVKSLAVIDFEDDVQPPGLCRPIVKQLQPELSRLGGGFALFGRYISSRLDLLPASECVVLEKTEDISSSVSYAWIYSQFQAEVGRSLEEAYVVFESEPFESRVLYQSHSVRLHSGEDAIVRVLKPHAKESLAIDLKLLNLLEPVCMILGWPQDLLKLVLAQFENALTEQMDFVCEASALQLYNDETRVETDQIAKVWPAWCSSSFLTVTGASDHSLSLIINQLSGVTPSNLSIERRRDLAFALCRGWVRRVFEGGLFPVAPSVEYLWVSTTPQLCIVGGQFSRLTPEMRENLWTYLNSVALHDPDKACECLLLEMTESPISGDVLKHLFRQVVPFRDGGWDHMGHLDTLPEHAFLQWRIAGQQGCRPNEQLIDFIRGFSSTACVAYRLVPHEDIFGEALETYRDQRQKERFQAAFDMGQWSDAMDKYATTFSQLPQKVDDLLSRAAGGKLNIKFRLKEASEHREARNTSAIGLALVLVLVSLVLIANHLSNHLADGKWIEQVGAVIFMVVGGVLLRLLTKSKV
ncbi:MAG: AarF/ABC1/UbiB kinase family protein [Candidatus Latescibacteria bacterium]|nr:AarF/ABC1/UbiB kinase family protein [Candidatus Latescibacterota bacterium]